MERCPFCHVEASRIAFVEGDVVGLWDAFPVTEGHLLLTPKRHVASWAALTHEEQVALIASIRKGYELLGARFSPDGVNVGWNDGAAAGQTIPHVHVHLIPRRSGDMADPRGGVRHVIPSKGNYLAPTQARPDVRKAMAGRPHGGALIQGGEDDPLLAHLLPLIDEAQRVDVAVAFILESGVRLLQPHLQDLLDRGGSLRLVTGDYLDVTDPDALRRLLDLEGDRQLWVFESRGTSFHPKAWIMQAEGDALAIVGSSNWSATALRDGVEWNFRLQSEEQDPRWQDVKTSFETLLAAPQVRALNHDWIDAYAERRAVALAPTSVAVPVEVPVESPPPPPAPHVVQQQALAALQQTRANGYRAGLVVLATGMGKTWLSAFDSEQFGRVLFVAHRDEILNQATETFRTVRPHSRLGRFSGRQKDYEAEVLFASVQTLSQTANLEVFEPTAFDYIVIDEFHHAAAATYRRLIQHFRPRFLLGLTATPERMDGGDLLGLCEENLVFRCDAFDGIKRNLLSPFRYFGVPDEVDYSNIPWRNARFDEAALTAALATRARAANALQELRRKGGKRALGFCASQAHADFMADFARERGLRAAAVHAGPKSAPRTSTLEALAAGDLDIVFSVDMFNEGVDVPSIDTVLMLRPTESTVVWMQQFGRGLRRSPGKSHLAVIDYIGNHRSFLTKARALLQVDGDRDLAIAFQALKSGELQLPEGCEITYELEALDLLNGLLKPTRAADAAEAWFRDFEGRFGRRPTALEFHHAGFHPGRTGHGGWMGFLRHLGSLTASESAVIARHGALLDFLASTGMTRSYKMLVLRAMLQAGAFPGRLALAELTEAIADLAERNPRFRNDLSVATDDRRALSGLLVRNPITAWTSANEGGRFFQFDHDAFSTRFLVDSQQAGELARLVEEIVDWRIGAYLDRSTDEARSAEEVSPLAETAEQDPGFVGAADGLPELWREYMREQIPEQFGLPFGTGLWNQGFVVQQREVFLLVTLNKQDLMEQHGYEDRFLDAKTFAWQSQTRTTLASKHGRIITGALPGYRIHLFVRANKRRPNGGASPFVYCGLARFVAAEGETPISVTWALKVPVPQHFWRSWAIEE